MPIREYGSHLHHLRGGIVDLSGTSGSVGPDTGRCSLKVGPWVEHQGGVVLRGEMGCIMRRNKALGVALMAAMSGSLLVGCTSDSATTATSSTPPANPLVGTWQAEGTSDNPVVVLELAADGTWKYLGGPSQNRIVVAGEGTYEVDGTR